MDSTSPPYTLGDYPGVIVGWYGYSPYAVHTSAPGYNAIDGIPCSYGMAQNQHFHVHVSLFIGKLQYSVPAAIGIYAPHVRVAPYFYDADPAQWHACIFDIHTHTPDGVVHIESSDATRTFTLKNLFDIWGVAPTPNGFWLWQNRPTRVFLTDEGIGGPGTYPVQEITGVDFSTITLHRHQEITIEAGTPNTNIRNYSFYGSL
ncbi:MAG: hypothetical protein NVSMB64_24500 [Candidatus Velthaea sp.]